MTREEIIADERYHTCGRCRWGDLNDDFYPCNKCNHSADKREDLWQYAEEVEECRDTANLLDLGVDCISRAQTQTEIEMNASRYTIAKERGGMGQVEWSDQLIKVSDAVDIIRHLPSVTPQERKGHWIPTYGNVECSVCGSVKDSRNVGKATHYCDFCGARMVEPQESEAEDGKAD